MALQAIVRRGYTFSRNGERITTDKLNAVGLPIIDIVGTVDAASIGTSITDANVATNAQIQISKLKAWDGAVATADALIRSDSGGVLDAVEDSLVTGDLTVDCSSGIDFQIKANAVTTTEILDGAVTSAKILDATIVDGDLAASVEWTPARLPDATVDGSSTATHTVDWTTGYIHKVTLDAASVTISFSGAKSGQSILLILVQDAGGSRAPSFTDTIAWRARTTPTWSTTANYVDVVSLWYDGSSYYGSAGIDFGI